MTLVFASHVFWSHGFGGRFDRVSAFIAADAAAALFRFNVGVMPMLGGCAVFGLVGAMHGLGP